jgi:general stress protein 26
MDSTDVDTKDQLTGDAAIKKLRSLLPQFQSAMMVTHTSNNEVHVRPLALQGDLTTFGGVLWFFTDDRSRKIQESAGGVPVSIICQSDQASAYVHLTGVATEVRDLPKMRELYTPILKTWFPEGLDDPHLTLIKFEALGGSYWDSPGGRLQSLAAFAVAIATGTPRKGGEAGELHL